MSEASENDTPLTGIEESDPSADSHEGLAGDLGVSSERKGPVLGRDHEVTHAAAPNRLDDDPSEGEAAPEQSAYDGRPEANPESPGAHDSDPDSNPGHGR